MNTDEVDGGSSRCLTVNDRLLFVLHARWVWMSWSPSTSCLSLSCSMSTDELDPSTSSRRLTVSYLFFNVDEYGRVGSKYVIPLFERLLLVLQRRWVRMRWIQVCYPVVWPFLTCSSAPMSMDEVDLSMSFRCLTVSYLFFRADEYGGSGPQAPHACLCLVLWGLDKVDPSPSTCCLTVCYLFFRAWIKWIRVHRPVVWPFLTCSSGHGQSGSAVWPFFTCSSEHG